MSQPYSPIEFSSKFHINYVFAFLHPQLNIFHAQHKQTNKQKTFVSKEILIFFSFFYFSLNRLGSLFGYKPTQSNQHFNDTANVADTADCLSTNNETKKSE